MLQLLKALLRVTEWLVALPLRAGRFVFTVLLFNPRLGRLRLVVAPVVLWVLFAAALAYVYAPMRGLAGQVWMGKALHYFNERTLGTAIYDQGGRFVGIFDPVLDSEKDFNYTGAPIELPGYIAYPDHKSLHVSAVPEDYWRCLVHLEDRHLGGLINPFGIDFLGALKIPWSTIEASLQAGSPRLGAGGSTLAMQLARIFVKQPPSGAEGVLDKITRKATEWWLAPVIQRELVRAGDLSAFKLWAANHFPLAQRTGGQPLYGVEQTSLIVFGKPSAALDTAEQYVLAAAVNRPIILLPGGDRLNARRAANWRHVAGVRARLCAEALIAAPAGRERTIASLDRLAQSPPDPQTPPETAQLLASLAPHAMRPAGTSPIRRSNLLIPAVKYGAREELKNRFGFGWRTHVRSVRITLDVAANLRLREEIIGTLSRLQERFAGRIEPGHSLDLASAQASDRPHAPRVPDIVIAAADAEGRIVRYFESNQTAAYFGSARARDPRSGRYQPAREPRFIASVAKMAAAVAIANEGTDAPDTSYLDIRAPETGLEACGTGSERRLRRADVAFACSLNAPLEWRLGRIAPARLRVLADGFGLVAPLDGPPLSRGLVIGQMAASPRTVHRMAGLILASLTGREAPLLAPRLVHDLETAEGSPVSPDGMAIPPAALIRPQARPLLAALLSQPLCHPRGTLRRLGDWCARSRTDVSLHFAKTGTRGTGALDAAAYDTVDLWVAGGIEFAGGAAYSYVVLVGNGNPSQPWARDLYAGAVTEPLVRVLLEDLALDAREIGRRRHETAKNQPDHG